MDNPNLHTYKIDSGMKTGYHVEQEFVAEAVRDKLMQVKTAH